MRILSWDDRDDGICTNPYCDDADCDDIDCDDDDVIDDYDDGIAFKILTQSLYQRQRP